MNPHQILGISQNATEEEIKTAYRKMVLKFHPDRNKGVDPKKIVEINKAYAELRGTGSTGGTGRDSNTKSNEQHTGTYTHFYGNPFSGSITEDEFYADFLRGFYKYNNYTTQREQPKKKARQPLTVKQIKKILYEDVINKSLGMNRQFSNCDLCGINIEPGETYVNFNYKKACRICQMEIAERLK